MVVSVASTRLKFTWLPAGFTVAVAGRAAKLFEALPGNENGIERRSISGGETRAGARVSEHGASFGGARQPNTCNDMSA